MKMCEEMKKLRAELDKRGIPWEDRSTSTPDEVIHAWIAEGFEEKYVDVTVHRTRFAVGENEYSVINGYCTYGGFDPCIGDNLGLLECMVSGNGVIGYLSVEDVINIFDKKGNKEGIENETEN